MRSFPQPAASLAIIPAAVILAAAVPLLAACDGRSVPVSGVLRSAATLSALQLSAGQLAPAFSPSITSYSATVSFATDQITVTPTAATAGATIVVNGAPVPSGKASPPNNLVIGTNQIDVIVTNPDGLSTRTYVIQVTRSAF